ncbi:lysophospholipid acyltransferase [Pancytospora philotis]|nr:lysophospholipid acyltransferase [Pancytospora philotis]
MFQDVDAVYVRGAAPMFALLEPVLNNIQLRYGLSLLVVLLGSYRRAEMRCARVATVFLALYFAYGARQVSFIAASLALNLGLFALKIPAVNEYVYVALNIVILYIFKIFGHRVDPYVQSTYDISGFLMLMVIKMSYLARDWRDLERTAAASSSGNDAAQNAAANGQAGQTRVSNKAIRPCLGDALDYVLFIPGILSGPTPSFGEYMAHKSGPSRGSVPTAKLLKTLLFLTIYTCFVGQPFQQWILAQDKPLYKRLGWLYLYNAVLRMKYHFIWGFADCCFIMNGFDDLLNIDFRKVELTVSVREISVNWNKFMSRWLRTMFFDRFKERSKAKAAILTYVISSFVHGINACYLIFFCSLAVFSRTITRVNELLHFQALQQLQMIGFVTFFSMPFYLLSLKQTYLIWKSVYFYGLVYCFGLMLLFQIVDMCRRAHKNGESINKNGTNAGKDSTYAKKQQ